MFQIGETVFYSGSGICRIDSITSREFGGETRDYYVLIPEHKAKSVVYLPVDNQALLSRMRQPLTEEQVHRLIDGMPLLECGWIEEESSRKREFQRILQQGDQREIILMIHAIFLHRQQLKERGRKLHQCDERALREGQQILSDEFSYVLHIQPEEVESYIIRTLDGEES